MVNPYATPSSNPSLPGSGEIDTSSPFSPGGRFGRLSYIAWYMLVTIISYLLMFAVGGAVMLTEADPEAMMGFLSSAGGITYMLIALASMVFFILFTIRRLHDLNKTGWLTLLIVIPFINIIFMIYLFAARGDEGVNRFAGIRPTPAWEKILGYIGIVFFILTIAGILMAVIMPAMVQI